MASHRPVRVVCVCGRHLTATRRSMTTVTVPRHKCPTDAPEHIRAQASAFVGWCPVKGFKQLSDYAGPGSSVSLETKP